MTIKRAKMDWNPNIDAGIESGEYEIYGPFSDGFRLQFKGLPIGAFKRQLQAMEMAEAHAEIITKQDD